MWKRRPAARSVRGDRVAPGPTRAAATHRRTPGCLLLTAVWGCVLPWSSAAASAFDRDAALAFLDTQWSKYFTRGASPARNWESGFVPGGLWAMVDAEDAGLVDRGGAYLTHAQRWSQALVPEYPDRPDWYVPGDHDIGFVYPLGFAAGVDRLAGSPTSDRYADILRGAADKLDRRFNDDYRAIKSWNFFPAPAQPVIIDGMMTLELLEWSTQNGGPASHMQHALAHAESVIEHQLRSPQNFGSTTGRYAVHVVDLQPVTQGQPAAPGTAFFQSRLVDSPWSRGQGWAIAGFARLYENAAGFADAAQRDALLLAAQDLADYFLEQTADAAVPLWDFSVVTDPAAPGYDADAVLPDSSAGAIAASGLLRLARVSPDPQDRYRYHRAAERLLAALADDHLNVAAESDDAVVLDDVVGDYAGGSLGPRTFADYYFTRATLDFAPLLHGDADVDGSVGQSDLDAVLNNWGRSNLTDATVDISWVTGDYTGNGVVEQGDLDAVLNNWGSSAPPNLHGLSIPEPAAALLLLFSAIRRRRAVN